MKAYPKKIFIFGGTHGNEWTGIYAVTRYAEHFKRMYPLLKLEFIFANPEAHQLNKRFKDEDLNRAFQFLDTERAHSYEHARAAELKARIDAAPCMVIDLHTTTANMGKTLILTDYDPLNLYLACVTAQKFSDARIIGSPDPHKKYLASQSKHSLMIEVGPVANSVIDPSALEGTIALIDTILQALQDLPTELHGSFDLYEEVQDVPYPLTPQGELNAYIHSNFQGRDFTPVQGEITPFQSFDGQKISMNISQELYPIFINEAAYYPQHLAFTLCQKIKKSFWYYAQN